MFHSISNNKNRQYSYQKLSLIAGLLLSLNTFTPSVLAAENFVNIKLHGIEQQHTQSTLTLKQLRQSSLAGDSRAQFIYGHALINGKGIEHNHKEGLKWIESSAEQGFAVAQFQLALLLEYGQGIKANHQQAAKWHLKAAEQGNIGAQHSISMMYLDGKGIEKDLVNAYAWMSLAYENGYKEVASVRNHIKSKLDDNQQLQAKIRMQAYRNGVTLNEQFAFAGN